MKSNLFEDFLEYEQKQNLFDIEFDGFKIWELIRTYVYCDLERLSNNLQPLFPEKEKKKQYKTYTLFYLIKGLKMM